MDELVYIDNNEACLSGCLRKEDHVEYPMQIMKLMDMVRELGFTEDFLRRAVHSKYSEKFAFRTSKKGSWMIITAEFEKLRKRRVFG